MKNAALIGLVLFCLCSTQAQNILWIDSFSNEALTKQQWVTGNTPDDIHWGWTDNPAFSPFFPAFESPTVANGYIYYNSDQNGQGNAHNTIYRKVTPIDCSQASEVWVSFYSQYGIATEGADAFLEVSTDSIDFTSLPVLTQIQVGDLNQKVVHSVLDISNLAAGQSKVYLRFRWQGEWEYIWKIDDVGLYDGNPLPRHDLRLEENFFAIPPAHRTPVSQRLPMALMVDVLNAGLDTQTNVVLTSTVVFEEQDTLFRDTIRQDFLPPGQRIENIPFEKRFFPPDSAGHFELIYRVGADSLDQGLDSNVITYNFLQTEGAFAKDDDPALGVSFFANDSPNGWSVANHFFLPEGLGYAVDHVLIEFRNAPENAGEDVSIYLYKWEDINQNDLAEPEERGLGPDPQGGAVVGFSTYTLKGLPGTEQAIVELIPPPPAQVGDPIPLTDNSSYLLALHFPPANPPITLHASLLDYFAMTFANDLFGKRYYGGFIGLSGDTETELEPNYGVVPVLRMQIKELNTATRPARRQELQAEAILQPNPAHGSTRLNVTLTQSMEQLYIQLFSPEGRPLRQWELNRPGRSFQKNLSLHNLPPGIYRLRLSKGEKEKWLPLVVVDDQ